MPVRHNPTQVKRQIGLVPQDVALYGQLTLEENLRYFGAMHGLHGARLRERITACLGTAQLGRFADRRVATFSGGMRRRANIALCHGYNELTPLAYVGYGLNVAAAHQEDYETAYEFGKMALELADAIHLIWIAENKKTVTWTTCADPGPMHWMISTMFRSILIWTILRMVSIKGSEG